MHLNTALGNVKYFRVDSVDNPIKQPYNAH